MMKRPDCTAQGNMAPIKIREACDICDCINEKRPLFRNINEPWRGVNKEQMKIDFADNKSGWFCTNCFHPALNHHFTFEAPK
jgi:hypothetical protein